MKDVLILILMIAFGFFANAQIDAYCNTKPVQSTKSFKVNKMKVDFVKLEELASFKDKLAKGESGLEKLSIDNEFKFVYTLAEPINWEDKDLKLRGMKIEITDQPNRTELLKEINESIDGVLEIAVFND